jgi:Na+/melibiose symporter-like transporter
MSGTQGASIRFPASLLVIYALPAFALAMPTIPVYVYLAPFYAANLGVGLAATGIALLVARIFDVVTDPLIGFLSDRWRTRWGRRRPWIVAGAIIAASGLIALFQPPQQPGAGYLAFWAIVLFLGWTMIAVPYAAWGAELSADYHDRARITGAREMTMILGTVAAGGMPALAAATGGSEGDGLAWIAYLAVLIGAPSIALLVWRVPEAKAGSVRDVPRLRFADIREMAANKPFVRLVCAWLINGFANGLPAALFFLYVQYALQADEVTRGGLILLYFVAGIAGVPVWVRLSRRFGKHRTWCGAMALACAAFVWVPLLGPGDIIPFAVICVLTGLALGADLALPPAMQADVVDFDTLRTGKARAGVFFAAWSMVTKLALAFAVGIAFPLLAAFGFTPDGDNDRTAIIALAVIYAGVPAVVKLCAIAVIWRHPITARRQAVIRRRLDQRRQRLGAR